MRNVKTLMYEPIAGCLLNFSSPPILCKSSGNPNHVLFGQCRNAEINSSSNFIIKYFVVSDDQYMRLFAQKESQPSSLTDIYRETVKRYHDKGPPFPPGGSPAPNRPASPTTRTRSVRAARSPTSSSQSAHNATTQWTQTLRWRQPKRNRILILR